MKRISGEDGIDRDKPRDSQHKVTSCVPGDVMHSAYRL